jgi:hypothetical protein
MLFTRSSPGGGHKWVTDVGSLQSPPLFTAAHCCFKHQLVNPPARPIYEGSVLKNLNLPCFVKGHARAVCMCAPKLPRLKTNLNQQQTQWALFLRTNLFWYCLHETCKRDAYSSLFS